MYIQQWDVYVYMLRQQWDVYVYPLLPVFITCHKSKGLELIGLYAVEWITIVT